MTGATPWRRRTWIVPLVPVVALALAAGWVALPHFSAQTTTQTEALTPLADTYVRSDIPAGFYGSSPRVSAQTSAGQTRVAYLSFSLVLPEGATVTNATLRLRAVVGATRGGIQLRGVASGDWTEAMTWATRPATASTVTSVASGYAEDTSISLDATALTAPGGTVSMALTTPRGGGYQGFMSRESGHPPELVVTVSSTADSPPIATPTAASAPTAAAAEGPDGTQAAVVQGWGPVVSGDEFKYVGAPDPAKWSVYDSVGHAGKGIRSPAAFSVDGERVTIIGDEHGTTGGMSAQFDRRKYGRWETRMRSTRDPKYHPVLLLWPDSGNWPCDGEVDYGEGTAEIGRANFFHHFGCDNRQTSATKALDVTQWHNYAVEWTSAGIVGFIDGEEWFRDADPDHQPPGPMHQTLQLDWAPDGSPTTRSEMVVDWVRVYDADTPGAAPTRDVTIAAVGDMNAAGLNSLASPSGRNGAAIAAALDTGAVDAFFGLGDFQYETAYCSDYVNFWNPLWGATKRKLYWVTAPDHDWEPGRNEDLDDFMNGQCPGDPSLSAINAQRGFIGNGDPYSFDLGNWHFAMLSSALWEYDPARAREVTTWLDRDLATAKAAGKHLAVAHHEPYFAPETENHTRATDHLPWVKVMDRHDVRIVLSGSQHNYARTCPVQADDSCTEENGGGTTAFQVSTGGKNLRAFTSEPSYFVKGFDDTHGWLKLVLKADGGFAWEFMPVVGTGTDSGSRPAPQ
jgi:hypothetical protein